VYLQRDRVYMRISDGGRQKASLARDWRKSPCRGSFDQSHLGSDILFHVELAAAGMSLIDG